MQDVKSSAESPARLLIVDDDDLFAQTVDLIADMTPGIVVVGGPLGAVAAKARGARTVVPPIAATAVTPTLPMINRRRVKPGLPGDWVDSLMAATLGNANEHDVADIRPSASGFPDRQVTAALLNCSSA